MKKVFVDTNILIDLLANRKPFSKFAIALFSRAERKKIKLFTSSHSIATTYYLLKKYTDDTGLRHALLDLSDYVSVIAVDHDIIKKALKSKHKDFEDAIQIFCAGTIESIDCIVSRNGKDFKHSEIQVFSPEELERHLKD